MRHSPGYNFFKVRLAKGQRIVTIGDNLFISCGYMCQALFQACYIVNIICLIPTITR